MPKLSRIIEYQPEKQRTPSEVVEYIKDQIAAKMVDKVVVIYITKDTIGYVCGSDDRDYRQSEVMWDVEQWKRWYLEEVA